jgi:hypothetical protein
MELTKLKKFTDRIVTVDLELLAARETHSEFLKDIKLEMKKNQNFTPAEIRAVIKAAKIEITPLEKLAAAKEVDELAQAIVDTRRPNADGKTLTYKVDARDAD